MAIQRSLTCEIAQPRHETISAVAFPAMVRTSQPRQPTAPGVMRNVLGQNVMALMSRHYRDLPNDTARTKALSAAAGIGHETVRRAITGHVSLTLDNIERLALALDVSVYQLLLPNLDADNPQVVNGATAEERLLYVNLKRAALADRKQAVKAVKP